MSYLVIFAALLGLVLYFDLSMALSIGVIVTGMTVWAVLMNRKLPIPKW